ncbi:hypothetical protein C8R45DRAFT_964226 [Mycena sanguinolenta]|nr:hypothetical protein C8R45DRAFT_964226 [Mycena sanguinolenta]
MMTRRIDTHKLAGVGVVSLPLVTSTLTVEVTSSCNSSSISLPALPSSFPLLSSATPGSNVPIVAGQHRYWSVPLLVRSVGLFRWVKTQPQIPERPVDQRGPGNSGRQNMLGCVGHRTRWQTRSKE